MRTIITLLFVFSVSYLSGCDTGPPRPADLPALHRVTLTVMQGGVPLAGANITLTSKTPQAYSTASGTTNAEGVVVPRTYGFDGVPAGQYTVSVSKTAIEGGTEQMDGNTPIIVGGRIYQYVSAEYLSADSSPLSLDVGGRMEQTIDAGAAVREFIAENLRDT